MDVINEWLPYLQSHIPPSLLPTLHTILLSLANTLLTLRSLFEPLITRLLASPDLTSIILLLVVLFLSFKILGMAYRAVMFWVHLVLRAVFWGAILGGGLYVWSRGVDGAVEDAMGLYGFWWGEYERFKGEARLREEGLYGPQAAMGKRGGRWGGW